MKFNKLNENARPDADVYLIRLVTDQKRFWLEFPISVILELKIAEEISDRSLLSWNSGFIYIDEANDSEKVMNAIKGCDDINILMSKFPHVVPSINSLPRFNLSSFHLIGNEHIKLYFTVKFGWLDSKDFINHKYEGHSLVCTSGTARKEIKKYMKDLLLAKKQEPTPFFEAICVRDHVYITDPFEITTAFPVSGIVQ